MLLNEEEFIQKMKNNIYIFYNLPHEQQNYKICLEAIKIDPCTIIHIAPQFITPEIVSIALKKNEVFRYLPQYIITDDFIINIIQINPDIFKNIPKNLQTYEICLNAIKLKEDSLAFVRENILDYNLCLLSVVNNGMMIKYCSSYIDDTLCQLAVENNGNALEFIPSKFRTTNIILMAIKSTPCALKYVNDKEMNEDIINYTLEHYKSDYISEYISQFIKIITTKILHKIINNNKLLIEI